MADFPGKSIQDLVKEEEKNRKTPDEPSLLGEAGKGLAHGVVGLAESVGTGLQYLGGKVGDNDLIDLGETVHSYWKDVNERNFQAHDSLRGSIYDQKDGFNTDLLSKGAWWTYNVANIVPSLAASMVPAGAAAKASSALNIGQKVVKWTPAVASKLGRVGRWLTNAEKVNRGIGALAGGFVGGSLEGANTYQEVLDRGGSREEAEAAAEQMTAASAALNAISVNQMLKKLPDGVIGQASKRFINGLTEGITEWLEGPAEAAIILRGAAQDGSDLKFTPEEAIQKVYDELNVLPPSVVTGMIFGGGSPASVEQEDNRAIPEPAGPLSSAAQSIRRQIPMTQDGAIRRAQTLTKQGVPHGVVPHPTIPDRFTVQRVGAQDAESLRGDEGQALQGVQGEGEERQILQRDGEGEGGAGLQLEAQKKPTPSDQEIRLTEGEKANKRMEEIDRLRIDALKETFNHMSPGDRMAHIKRVAEEERTKKEQREDLIDSGVLAEQITVARRRHLALRESIDDMSPEERAAAIETLRSIATTSRVTGLKNKEAFSELYGEKFDAEDRPRFIAQIDSDSLKTVNDLMGHQNGDALLRATGIALGEAISGDEDAFHLSGDEFAATGNDRDALEATMLKARDRLKSVVLTGKTPDGREVELTGIDFSFGIAENIEEAENALGQDKARRQAAGERAARGELPPGIRIGGRQEPTDTGEAAEAPEVTTVKQLDKAANMAATSDQNDLPTPTQEQLESGDYPKGRFVMQDIPVSIENPRGSVRKGMDETGREWSQKLAHHYGDIEGTKGADGDPVDTFIGNNPKAKSAFVVNQVNPNDGAFDEHKVMLGFNSIDDAEKAYKENYEKGWQGMGDIVEVPVSELKDWLSKGDMKKEYRGPQLVDGKYHETKSVKGDVSEPLPDSENESESKSSIKLPKSAKEAKSQIRDNFNIRYKRVPVGEIKVGVDKITDPESLAHVASSFRKKGEEVFYAIVTDKDGKIIDVQFHSKGTKDGASVYPEVVGPSVASVPGAATVYFTHNHPSGFPDPSRADYAITARLNDFLDGAQVKFAGHVVVSRGGLAHFFTSDDDSNPVRIIPRVRNKTISITERAIRKVPKSGELGKPFTSPKDAAVAIRKIESENAILLFDNRHHLIGSLIMTEVEMRNLRSKGRVERILSAIDTTNASAAIIKTKTEQAAANVANFLSGKLHVLDAFVGSDDTFYSQAERGGVSEGGKFFSQLSQGKAVFNEGGKYATAFTLDTSAMRVAKASGKITGAPRDHNTQAKIEKVGEDILKIVNEDLAMPETSRDWYKRSGKALREMTRGNPELLERMVRIIALMSPDTNVQTNFTHAINFAYDQAINPGVENEWGSYPNNIQKAIDLGALDPGVEFTRDLWGVGPKVESFYRNLHDDAFNENKYGGAVTIDRWMARAIGYSSDRVTPQQYEFSSELTRQLTAEYNRRNGTRLKPRQFQAMVWVHELNKTMLADNPNYEPKDFSFAEAASQATSTIMAETIPSDKVAPELLNLGEDKARQFTEESLALIRSDDGSDAILDHINAPFYKSRPSEGAYAGGVHPNTVIDIVARKYRLPNGIYDRDTANLYAKALQYVYSQDSVVVQRAIFNPKNTDGLSKGYYITFDKSLNPDAENDILTKLGDIVSEGVGFTRTGDRTIMVTNIADYTGLDNDAFAAKMTGIINDRHEEMGIIDAYDFWAETNFDDQEAHHDWKKDPEGEALAAKIAEAGGRGLLAWLRGRREAHQALIRKYQEKVGGVSLVESEQESTYTTIRQRAEAFDIIRKLKPVYGVGQGEFAPDVTKRASNELSQSVADMFEYDAEETTSISNKYQVTISKPTDKQKSVLTDILGSLESVGFPFIKNIGVRKLKTGYFNSLSLGGYYDSESKDVVMPARIIDAALNTEGVNNENAKKIVATYLTHELSHAIDMNYDVNGVSATSSLFDIDPAKNINVVSSDFAEMRGAGEVIEEMFNVYQNELDPDYTAMLNYPFNNLPKIMDMQMLMDAERDLVNIGLLNKADYQELERAYASAINFIKREAFAQLSSIYWTRPDFVRRVLPKSYSVMEELRDAIKDIQSGASDARLRAVLRAPSPTGGAIGNEPDGAAEKTSRSSAIEEAGGRVQYRNHGEFGGRGTEASTVEREGAGEGSPGVSIETPADLSTAFEKVTDGLTMENRVALSVLASDALERASYSDALAKSFDRINDIAGIVEAASNVQSYDPLILEVIRVDQGIEKPLSTAEHEAVRDFIELADEFVVDNGYEMDVNFPNGNVYVTPDDVTKLPVTHKVFVQYGDESVSRVFDNPEEALLAGLIAKHTLNGYASSIQRGDASGVPRAAYIGDAKGKEAELRGSEHRMMAMRAAQSHIKAYNKVVEAKARMEAKSKELAEKYDSPVIPIAGIRVLNQNPTLYKNLPVNEQNIVNGMIDVLADYDAALAEAGANQLPPHLEKDYPGIKTMISKAKIRKLEEISGINNLAEIEDIVSRMSDQYMPVMGWDKKPRFKTGTEADSIGRAVVNEGFVSRTINSYQRHADSALNWVGSKLTWAHPLGNLQHKGEFLTKRRRAAGKIAKINQMTKRVFNIMRQATPEEAQAIYKYLTTIDSDMRELPDRTVKTKRIRGTGVLFRQPTEVNLRKEAVAIKRLIDKVGRQLVEHALIPATSYEHFRYRYLPRMYLAHILDDNSFRAITSGKKVSQLGYTKSRDEDLPELARIMLGEITDPAYLAAKGLGTSMRDVAILDFLDEISTNEDWVLPQVMVTYNDKRVSAYWLESEGEAILGRLEYMNPEDAAIAQKEASNMIATAQKVLQEATGIDSYKEYRQVPNTPRYGTLRGMYIRREIYDDLIGSMQTAEDDSIAGRILGQGGIATKATQLWKMSKVAMNPPAQIRNFISNGILVQLSGTPMHKIPGLVFRAFSEIKGNGKYWRIAQREGLTESTFAANELFRLDRSLLQLKKETGDYNAMDAVKNFAGAASDAVGDMYQFSEAVFKVVKLIDGMEREHLSAGEAAQAANDTLFDYSHVPPSVRYLRNAPVGVPFLTFYYKVLPNLVTTAVKYPHRFLPYVAVPWLMMEAVAKNMDVDDDDIKALKKALPEWLQQRGHAMILPTKDEHGRWVAFDYGYMVPWGMYWDAMKDIGRGEPGELIKTMGLFGGPVPDLITAVKTGKDSFTGKPIYYDEDPASKQVLDIMSYLWRMAMPTFMTDIGAAGHLYRNITGKVDPRSAEPLLTLPQASMRMVGVNLYPIDPEYTRQRNIMFRQYEIRDIAARARQRAMDRNLSPAKQKELARTYGDMIKQKTEELKKYMKESRVHPNLKTKKQGSKGGESKEVPDFLKR